MNLKNNVYYESLEISNNRVAFHILSQDNKVTSGITDSATWNNYLATTDDFIDPKNFIQHNLVLLPPYTLDNCPTMRQLTLDNDCVSLIAYQKNFDFFTYKANSNCHLYQRNYMLYKNYNFFFLKDLYNNIAYFEPCIYLPKFDNEQEHKTILLTLYKLLHNPLFDMVENDDLYHKKKTTKNDFISKVTNEINSLAHVDHRRERISYLPTSAQSLDTLVFKIPEFKDFNTFFNLTKQYVDYQPFRKLEKNFPLIMSLAMLKTFYSDKVSEEFFVLFKEDYTIAQCIAMEYKLKPKNNNIKRAKI